jgi:hypothetical protein
MRGKLRDMQRRWMTEERLEAKTSTESREVVGILLLALGRDL